MTSQLIKQVSISIMMIALLTGASIGEQLTLDQALRIAFANSPDMQLVSNSLDISESNLLASEAGLKSQFSLTLTPYSFSKGQEFDVRESGYITNEQTTNSARFSIDQPIKWTDGTLSVRDDIRRTESFSSSIFSPSEKRTTFFNSFTVSFNQPLFTYNRVKLTLKELELALENSRLNFAIQKLSIESRVTQQYLSLFSRQQTVKIRKQEYANAQESYEIIKSKVDAGISALEELYQADLTMANSRATLQNNIMQYEEAQDNFKQLLGVELTREFEITASVNKNLVSVSRDRALEFGLNNRMELRQRDIDIQNAYHNLIRKGAENEFRASLELSFGLTGTDDEFSDIYRSPSRDRSISLSVNIPLFDWGKKKQDLKAAQLGIENRQLDLSEEKKSIIIGIRAICRNIQNQEIQIDIAEKNVQNAQLTYEINLQRYKNGDLSSKDIGFYQTQLSDQQLQEISALISYQLALLDLKIASLWDFSKNQPVVTSTLMGNENE